MKGYDAYPEGCRETIEREFSKILSDPSHQKNLSQANAAMAEAGRQASAAAAKGKLHFLVGLPRGGKSTFSKGWLQEKGSRPRVVISGDDFRKAIHGHSYIPEAEPVVFAHMDVAVRALLIGGFDVLVDETSTTEGTISRYFKIDPSAEPILIDTPVEECINRAVATNKPYLVGPIRRIAVQLEALKADWDGTIQRLREAAIARTTQDIAV